MKIITGKKRFNSLYYSTRLMNNYFNFFVKGCEYFSTFGLIKERNFYISEVCWGVKFLKTLELMVTGVFYLNCSFSHP
jgi:hypothetical protein